MKPKRTSTLARILVAYTGPISALCAAPVFFGPATTISGDADVMTVGTQLYGFTESNSVGTFAGANFAAGNSYTNLGGKVTFSGFSQLTLSLYGSTALNPYGSLTNDYKNLLKGGAWVTLPEWLITVTLNELTPGRAYAPQVWVSDSRSNGIGRTGIVSGSNAVLIDYNATDSIGGVGQYTRGWFVASEATQAFTMKGQKSLTNPNDSGSSQLNAIQVRDVTGVGMWTGTGGNAWNMGTTANFSTNLDSAPLSTGTFTTLQNSLGAVIFGDNYWNNGVPVAVTQTSVAISPGGISGGLVLFQNTSARAYTITSPDALGITGPTEVCADGGGSVTLEGDHSYTGRTVIRSGSLTFKGNAGTGPITNTGTLAFDNGVARSYAGVISGTGSLTKLGAGTLTLSGVNTFTGMISVNGGKLVIGDGSTGTLSESSSVSIAAGATMEFTRTSFDKAGSRPFSGSGNLLFTGLVPTSPAGITSGTSMGWDNIGFSGTITAKDSQVVISRPSVVGSATLIATGMGQLVLSSSGTYSNNFVIQGRGWGEGFSSRGALHVEGILTGTVTMAGDARLTGSGLINSPIAETGGARALEIQGGGLTFAGTNIYSGDTILSDVPQLTLNYGTNNTGKLSDTGTTIFRGTSSIGLTGGTHAELTGATRLEARSTATITRNVNSSAIIDLGPITRGTGAILTLGAGSIAKTISLPVSGNFGSWLTINNNTLATRDPSGFIVPVSYISVPTVTGTLTDGMDQVLLTNSLAGNVALGPGAVININSLTRSIQYPSVIDTAGKTLRLGALGTVLVSVSSKFGGITFGAAPNSGILTAGGTANTAGILDFRTLGPNVTVNASITDNGSGVVSLWKSGTSELILNGNNSYSGGTTLHGGTLRIDLNTGLGTSPVTVAGDSVLGGVAGSVALTTLANPIVVDSGSTLTLAPTAQLSYTGVISGPGNLATSGAGGLSFATSQTYTGITTIGGGLVQIPAGVTLSGTSAITINNSENSGITNLSTLSVPGALTVNHGTVVTGGVFTNGNPTGTSPGSVTFSGITLAGATGGSFSPIYRGGSFTQNPGSSTSVGSGTITITGTSSPSPSVASGSVFTNNGGSVIAGKLVLNPSYSGTPYSRVGGTYLQDSGTTTINDEVIITGSSSSNNGALTLSGGTFSGARFLLCGVTTISGSAILNASGNFFLGNGGDSPTGPGNITQSGGAVNLTSTDADSCVIGYRGQSTYTLSGGTLNVSSPIVRVGYYSGGTFAINGGIANLKGIVVGYSNNHCSMILTGGRINVGAGGINTSGLSIHTLTLGGGMVGATADWTGAPKTTLSDASAGTTFDTLDAVDGITARTITISSIVSGIGKLVKAGAGTLVLSAVNTYTGTSVVNGGTLKLMSAYGSGTGTGSVTVATTATLAGTGTAAGTTAIQSGGTVAPGDTGTGTLKTGALTLAGRYACEINGTTSDKLTVIGDLTLFGTLEVTAINPGGTYVIATYTGVRSGSFTSTSGLPSGYQVIYNDAAKQIELKNDAFALWKTAKGLIPGNDAKTANPDNDGLNNLGEFAFDSNPLSGANSGKIIPKAVTLGGMQLMTLTLPVRAGAAFALSGSTQTTSVAVDGVFYHIQGSDSLTSFAVEVAEVTGTDATTIRSGLNLPALTDAGWSYRTFRLVPTVDEAPNGFLRARITD